MKRLIFSFIVLAACFFSCSKEKDGTPPKITVTNPLNSQQINGVDTIQIEFEVADNMNIENIQVSLKNTNDIGVGQSIVKRPDTKKYSFNELFYLNDILLESGVYYFDISASDGENTTRKYVQVNLNEVAKYREGIFISSYNGASSDVYLMDNSFQTSYYKNYVGDVLGIAVNSYHQQLIHSCYTSGSMIATDLMTNTTAWSVSAQSSSTPYYTGMILGQDHKVYTGYYDGRFKAFNTSGSASINGLANQSFYIEKSALLGDYYVTEQQSIPVGQVNIVLNWAVSGVQFQQAIVNEDIKGIYQHSNNEMILLTNTASNTGNVAFYYLSTGLIGHPFSLSIGKIEDCVEISSGLYLVAEGNNLTYINTTNFTTLTYLVGVNANLLRFDSFSNELFVVDGNQLTIYDYSSKAVKSIYSHPTAIVDLDFWYNK
ncbi:MAG: hypothetical protein P1U41_08885 [Vicingaceae bacterium]|jgi:hypothetical protein|nr:hypothetical protein [Vicingaceae bacterium]